MLGTLWFLEQWTVVSKAENIHMNVDSIRGFLFKLFIYNLDKILVMPWDVSESDNVRVGLNNKLMKRAYRIQGA